MCATYPTHFTVRHGKCKYISLENISLFWSRCYKKYFLHRIKKNIILPSLPWKPQMSIIYTLVSLMDKF
jgi:hypothetical protein